MAVAFGRNDSMEGIDVDTLPIFKANSIRPEKLAETALEMGSIRLIGFLRGLVS